MPRPIKVCQIITSLGYGGAERVVYDLCANLDRRRFAVSVITVNGGGIFAEQIQALKIPITVCHKRTKLGLGVFFELTRLLKRAQPDIVHTHLFAGDFWGQLAAQRAGIKQIISTEHNVNRDEGQLKHSIKSFLYSQDTRVIAISQAVKKYLQNVLSVPEKKIVVIYNGVDSAGFGEPAAPSAIRKIGVFGRFVAQKGQAVLLRALAELPANLEINFYGQGPDLFTLKRLIKKIKLKQKIRFNSPVAPGQVAHYLKQQDLIVIPSLWEGLSIVALEAALAGRPIIASAIGGLNEVIIQNKTGVLVPPNNPRALAKAITYYQANPVVARKFAAAGRVFVAANFSLKQMINTYEKIYEDLTNK